MDKKRLLSVREAAGPNWLNCDVKTVYKLVKTDGFPALRVGEKRIFIPADLLEDWIRQRAVEPLDI
mgnify:CR=1 FL=1